MAKWQAIIRLLLAMALCCIHSCNACSLTEKIYDASSGLLHRCLNVTGTNEWHMNVACWLHSQGSSTIRIKELEAGETYRLTDGRVVAECRSTPSGVALVHHACLNVINKVASNIMWPGDVWTGSDGLNYTCTKSTNTSLAVPIFYNQQGSRAILHACNSTSSGRLVSPGSTELEDRDGIISRCEFSAAEGYVMKPIGCWLRSRANPLETVQLAIDQKFNLPTAVGRVKPLLAVCKENHGLVKLVYTMCVDNGTYGEIMRRPGDTWTLKDGLKVECLPSIPSELSSARVIPFGCYDHSNQLMQPGSEMRIDDGTTSKCMKSHSTAYHWHLNFGCWLKGPIWSKVTNRVRNLRAGADFCLSGKIKTCLATCAKRREKVALVSKVCFENVGKGALYRKPNEKWTDENGVSQTCLSMPDQYQFFGISAQTIRNGCQRKSGTGIVAPGELVYEDDFIVYKCVLNKALRKYELTGTNNCWMTNLRQMQVQIALYEAYKLPTGEAVASCRRMRSHQIILTREVCFSTKLSSPLKWEVSSIAFPGQLMSNGSSKLLCNPAEKNPGVTHARWIAYGCLLNSEIAAPGTATLSADGLIRECVRNKKEGTAAIYDWINPVGCWFRDHTNQTISIMQFNVAFIHSAIGKAAANCVRNRSADPKLQMLVCFSAPNGRFYFEGDKWTEKGTGLAKQCVRESRSQNDGVVTVDAGCWLEAANASSGNSSTAPQTSRLLSNYSVTYGSEKRVLKCEFNEQSSRFEWRTSVACWYYNSTGAPVALPIGQELWSKGVFRYKCYGALDGAKMVQHACEHNGIWHRAMSVWRDSSYQYQCVPASGYRSAKVEKTECITGSCTGQFRWLRRVSNL